MQQIKLCSDDFGLSDPVDNAIIRLVELGRLNAISCMVVGSTIEKNIEKLLKAVEAAPIKVEVGLHITLTEYKLLIGSDENAFEGSFPSIGQMLIKSHLGRLNSAKIENEIIAQFDRFKSLVGKPPEFADGHQHVHVLPIVCPVFIKIAKKELPQNGWVRSCWQPVSQILASKTAITRSLLISFLSTKLRSQSKNVSLKTNDRFLGVNEFKADQDFAKLMQVWFSTASQFQGETLIMCHPGLAEKQNDIYDPISNRRPDEYAYLSSLKFIQDIEAHGFNLEG